MSVSTPASGTLTGKQKGALVVAALKAAGIDLVATLPDSWLTDIIEAVDAEPSMSLVRVTREEEAVGLCAGAFLGGRKAAVLAQNAGVLLSVNALAGLAMHHQIPFLVLVAFRGGAEDNQYYQVYKGRVTEPVLQAIGLPYHWVKGPADYRLVVQAERQASLARLPVLLLFDRPALLGDEGAA
ncbi:MAG: sulfopyruvate decarboxylase subunit alpha [Proteobacteria bacterium]|nr:sulfopyruvate decarboxylase subunit alpha [Pseudomonadota bacterium]